METTLETQVRTALEVVRTHRGKKIVKIHGRTCSNEAQVEQAALLEGMSQQEFDALIGLPTTEPMRSTPAPVEPPIDQTELPSSEKEQSHETTLLLTPGSALRRPDGLLPAIVQGEPGPIWCLPGDFKLYLEAGEDDDSGRVREILVGPFREFDDRNDHELTPGNFLTDPEWDYVVGSPRSDVMHLVQEIGFDPSSERPEESKPRGESWLAERADADAKLSDSNAKLAALQAQVEALQSTSTSGLPASAREILVGVKGVGEALADAILAAFASPSLVAEAPAPSQQEGA